jgi:hypothetical protein
VKNDYGTGEEAKALNGLEEPLKIKNKKINNNSTFTSPH